MRTWLRGCLISMAALVAAANASANPVNARIAALPEVMRQGLFARLLEDEKCSTVSRTFFQGLSPDGAAFWSVSCANGKNWQVMIKNDSGGSTQYLDCAIGAALGSHCFKRFN